VGAGERRDRLGCLQSFIVAAPVDAPPVVTVFDQTALHGQVYAASQSQLFTVSDADHDAITQYDFWNTGTGGGRFLLAGTALGTGQDNYVSAAQLAQLNYRSGSGTDTLYVRRVRRFRLGCLVARL